MAENNPFSIVEQGDAPPKLAGFARIIHHSRHYGGVLDPYNDLGDNPFGDASDDGPYSGWGGGQMGPDMSSWVPDVSGGGSGGGTDIRVSQLEEELKRQQKLYEDGLSAIRDATKVVVFDPKHPLFKDTYLALKFDIIDSTIDALNNKFLAEMMDDIIKGLVPFQVIFGGLLLSILATLTLVASKILLSQISVDKLPEFVENLRQAGHLLNDIERQKAKRELAMDALADCPGISPSICDQAQKDYDDANNQMDKDWIALQLLAIKLGWKK